MNLYYTYIKIRVQNKKWIGKKNHPRNCTLGPTLVHLRNTCCCLQSRDNPPVKCLLMKDKINCQDKNMCSELKIK